MRRVLALVLPSLSIDLAQRRRDRAARVPGRAPTSCVLLTETRAGRALVVERCNEAARRGVRVGLSLAEAQALIDPRVRARSGPPWVEERSESRDLRALHGLGNWLMARFSPVVALDPPDALLVDVAGTERLFGEEDALCRALLRAMHAFALGARIGVADTPGCALAVARHGRTPRTLVESGEEARALGPLPVDALRIAEATVEGFAELGVTRVQDLLALDRDRVAARFGGDVALRLDQALGRAFEPVTPLRFETPPQTERVFDGPVRSLEAISLTAEELVDALAVELERARRGVLEAVLVLHPSDIAPRTLPLALARPSANPRHLWSMLRPKVETAHLGFGIERVRFTATRTGRLPARQVQAWTDPDDAANEGSLGRALGELVDALGARLGPDRIVRPHPVATHLPERAFTLRPPEEAPPRRSEPPAALPPAERPSRLFSPPEPASFEALDEH
ncbi:MAG: DNA polymerase Y family protein, partial [Planctomycetota bacterium]